MVRVRYRVSSRARQIASLAGEHIGRMVARAAVEAMASARIRAPRRTGNLANSIFADPEDRGGLVWIVGTPVHYAPYVELGTRRMAARPYLFPSVQQAFDNLIKTLDALERALR
jgi:hypothetical protein